VLNRVAAAAAELLESQFAGVYLLEPPAGRADARGRGGAGGTFVLAAGCGLDTSREAYRQFPRRGSLGGRALRAGRTAGLGRAGPRALPALASGRSVGALLVAPIFAPPLGAGDLAPEAPPAGAGGPASGDALGVVEVYATEPRPWSGDDERLLTALATAAGVV